MQEVSPPRRRPVSNLSSVDCIVDRPAPRLAAANEAHGHRQYTTPLILSQSISALESGAVAPRRGSLERVLTSLRDTKQASSAARAQALMPPTHQ